MIASLFVLGKDGTIALQKSYKGVCHRSLVPKFIEHISQNSTKEERAIEFEDNFVLYLEMNDVIFMAVLDDEVQRIHQEQHRALLPNSVRCRRPDQELPPRNQTAKN
jgi:hypothetical protein